MQRYLRGLECLKEQPATLLPKKTLGKRATATASLESLVKSTDDYRVRPSQRSRTFTL